MNQQRKEAYNIIIGDSYKLSKIKPKIIKKVLLYVPNIRNDIMSLHDEMDKIINAIAILNDLNSSSDYYKNIYKNKLDEVKSLLFEDLTKTGSSATVANTLYRTHEIPDQDISYGQTYNMYVEFCYWNNRISNSLKLMYECLSLVRSEISLEKEKLNKGII